MLPYDCTYLIYKFVTPCTCNYTALTSLLPMSSNFRTCSNVHKGLRYTRPPYKRRTLWLLDRQGIIYWSYANFMPAQGKKVSRFRPYTFLRWRGCYVYWMAAENGWSTGERRTGRICENYAPGLGFRNNEIQRRFSKWKRGKKKVFIRGGQRRNMHSFVAHCSCSVVLRKGGTDMQCCSKERLKGEQKQIHRYLPRMNNFF